MTLIDVRGSWYVWKSKRLNFTFETQGNLGFDYKFLARLAWRIYRAQTPRFKGETVGMRTR